MIKMLLTVVLALSAVSVHQEPSRRDTHLRLPDSTVVRCLHASIVMDAAFSQSQDRWNRTTAPTWDVAESGDLSQSVDGKRFILVLNDCDAAIQARERSIIHVQGNVNADVTCGPHSDVVIGGDIATGATVRIADGSSLFVGGDVHGVVQASGLLDRCWIDGHLLGAVAAAESMRLHVNGDVRGAITPGSSQASLRLVVDGFMPGKLIREMANTSIQFQATIARSDEIAGLHPTLDDRKSMPAPQASMWVVQSREAGTERNR